MIRPGSSSTYSRKKLIPAGVEDLGFHTKVRAVQGHSSLPRKYDPSSLGELLDVKMRSDMGYIFHASSNVNYDSVDAHGLVLSPYSHGIGHEKGRVGVHFVYAGGVTQSRHGTAIRSVVAAETFTIGISIIGNSCKMDSS